MIDLSIIRPVLELLYEGRADIYYTKSVKDDFTKLTRGTEKVTIAENEPCRISHESGDVSTARPLPRAEQTVKLFIAPELNIPAGSTVVVRQLGREITYNSSSEPKIYASHQEILLERKSETLL